MKKVFLVFAFISFCFSINVKSQLTISFIDSSNIVPDKLDGFRKATKADLGGSQLALNIMGVDAYLDGNSQKLERQEIMVVLMSSNYVITPYIDDEKTVKVIFFSFASETQKAKMKKLTGTTKQGESIGEISALKNQLLPNFTVTDINGKSYNSDELIGKVVVINFWFVACKPCIMEIPDLNKLVESYKNAEVVFIALALNSATELKDFIDKNPFVYNIVPDAMELANLFGVKEYPTHIIVDKNGKIVHAVSGLSASTIPIIKAFIDGLVK